MERRKPLQRKTPLKRTGAIKWNPDAMCKHGRRRGDCRSCISSRNKRFGQAVQREMHQALGGTGPTPHDEESGRGYTVEYRAAATAELLDAMDEALLDAIYKPTEEVKVHPEAKAGQQIPASIQKFLDTDWYRRALSQSQRSLPVGSNARPAVWLHMPGGRKVLIVDFGGGK